ncbi:FAD-dependent oxidoreductase [Phytoactinopolyspora sp. XMNu-373]|uniref:FAD-dependent oxidoreductase n=1 Tax=Phytoactinopolyspora mesophila TaxID=2650750 RepID=A0A7K3M4V6_9ACTN|nr:FAD-dependent oxidoreductase [Phytoactinopolyspora mesophila]
MVTVTEHVRVVVVGAGAAGLAAALELRRAGAEVTVLEARPRVGGRIHTVTFPDGRWANAGAEWVNSDHHLVRELAAAYGLALIPARGFEAFVVEGRLHEEEPSELSVIGDALERLANGLTDPDAPWRDRFALDLDRRNVAEWLDELRPPDTARAWIETYARGEYMVEPHELSLAVMALAVRLDTADTAFRFADGTAALVEAMTRDLGSERIRLGEPVQRIEHDASGVSVVTHHAEYEADDVVVTAPLPAVDQITIDPAIEVPSVGQGRGGKLLVPYPSRGWDRVEGDADVDAAFDFVYENAPDQPGSGRVLTAYGTRVIGDDDVHHAFATWFPDLETPDGDAIAAWWSTEPETGCTYSAFRPGDLPALARIREPFGRIHLAGEHTEVVNGYVESALRSGRRVANRILERASSGQIGGEFPR